MSTDWIENKCDELIQRIKRSQYAKECFADARWFHEQGYVMDVALAQAWNYWK